MAFQFLNRNAHLPATPSEVATRFDKRGDDWMMTDAERLALAGLLAELRPECAIEVGVYRAGSLAVLSRFCKKVYALDINPGCETMFGRAFDNVEFVTGDAMHTLPRLLTQIADTQEPLGFILIDADHSRDSVQRDIENVLRYTPVRPLYIVMHDSFNPECRRGMRDADWATSPYVHMVELDFVVGRFVTKEEPDSYRQMWCGFGLAILLPEKYGGKVVIHQNEALLFQSALRHSVYWSDKWWNLAYLARELKYRAKRLLRHLAPGFYEALRKRLHRTSR